MSVSEAVPGSQLHAYAHAHGSHFPTQNPANTFPSTSSTSTTPSSSSSAMRGLTHVMGDQDRVAAGR